MLVLLCLVVACAVAKASYVAENEAISFEFSYEGFLISFVDRTSDHEQLAAGKYAGVVGLWDVDVVGADGPTTLVPDGSAVVATTLANGGVALTWPVLLLPNSTRTAAVCLAVTFPSPTSVLADWQLSVSFSSINSINDVNSGAHVGGRTAALGIWSANVHVPLTVGAGDEGELFFPNGLGTAYSQPLSARSSAHTSGTVSAGYPSGGASMQFMALGSEGKDLATGAYVGTHDPDGYIKGFNWAAVPEVDRSSSSSSSSGRGAETDFSTSVLSVTLYPEDAGMALPAGETWTPTFAVKVGVLRGVSAQQGRPLYYEAALLYRAWALAWAPWAQTALAAQKLPKWFRETSVWINTHWQCHDVFNVTGGDPDFVVSTSSEVAELLGQETLGLHYYEWQQGPDAGEENRYKFDTHYPDYFPTRAGFTDAVESLRAKGVVVVPYINGRIFDVRSDSFKQDDGAHYCSKSTDERLVREPGDMVAGLEVAYETYGSRAVFCVASPATTYWQDKIAGAVAQLMEATASGGSGVQGVYIDQVGASPPVLCWDSTHGHHLGGGRYWKAGYSAMLRKARAQVARERPTGDDIVVPLFTESNAENYMDSVQGFLVLNSWKNSVAQGAVPRVEQRTTKRHVPAFPVVYGGYYVGLGAEWFRADWQDHDWWCGKLAQTFSAGTQMGWFSLAGRAPDPQDSCGPMGVSDLLLAPEHRTLVDFLKRLASYRTLSLSHMFDGSLARPPVLSPPPRVHTSRVKHAHFPLLQYDSVSASAWLEPSRRTVRVILVSTVAAVDAREDSNGDCAYEGRLVVHTADWHLPSSDSDQYAVSRVAEDGTVTPMGVFAASPAPPIPGGMPGRAFEVPVAVMSRNVLVLDITPV